MHRATELATLRAAFDAADAGRGSIVCVAGDAGIGKTTLLQDFLDQLPALGLNHLVAIGTCSERLGGAEAYGPVVDALGSLFRDDASGSIARLMKVVANSWYIRVVGDVAASETNRPSSQQALLRGFCAFLCEAARVGVVVLVFEDFHWADVSAVDLLAYIGRHLEGLRTLVLVTYRPTELLLGPHPFHRIKLELQSRGICTELSLGFLQRRDIDQYLEMTFPGHRFPVDFSGLIFSRTEGRPLFMTESLRYLRERGVIAETDGAWSLVKELPDVWQELPESVRGMIKRKLDRLGEGERRLLSAASIHGHEFDTAIVADMLKVSAADIEEQLDILHRVHALVRPIREHEFPDGTLSLRYAFVHLLYQNTLLQSLQPSRKMEWSLAAAEALVRHYGENRAAVATELAMLFEAARQPLRAIDYFLLVAQNAIQVFAHHEAVKLARRGLSLLPKVPDIPAREQSRTEVTCQPWYISRLHPRIRLSRSGTDIRALRVPCASRAKTSTLSFPCSTGFGTSFWCAAICANAKNWRCK